MQKSTVVESHIKIKQDFLYCFVFERRHPFPSSQVLNQIMVKAKNVFITGPLNGRILLFCSLVSVICNAAGGRAGRPRWRSEPPGGRHCTVGQYGNER